MCGRIYVKQTEAFDKLLPALGISEQLPLLLNVAPSQQIPVIRQLDQEKYTLNSMRWWLHPAWSATPPNQKYAMFNAKIETVLTNRSFRGPILRQRAVIPVAGFIEWRTEGKLKRPFYIDTANGEPLLFAGIWENWRDEILSCAIITQPAVERFQDIHDRMPLSLTVEQSKEWLSPDNDGRDLVTRFCGKTLVLRPREILPTINNAKNKVDVDFVPGTI